MTIYFCQKTLIKILMKIKNNKFTILKLSNYKTVHMKYKIIILFKINAIILMMMKIIMVTNCHHILSQEFKIKSNKLIKNKNKITLIINKFLVINQKVQIIINQILKMKLNHQNLYKKSLSLTAIQLHMNKTKKILKFNIIFKHRFLYNKQMKMEKKFMR